MKTILIVDDEPNVREGLIRILRRSELDATCQTAESGRQALEKIESEGADVIVSDVNMPGMDGIELLTRLRANPSTQRLPVIMLTGNDQGDIRRTALDLGAFDFLIKPTDPVELVARLRNALRIKSYEDQLRERNQLFEDQIVQLQRLENLSFMAAGIVHDLNGTMTILSGHLQLIEIALKDGAPVAKSIAVMGKAIDNAQALMRRILDLNRQETPVTQSCSLTEIVSDTLSVLRHTVRGRIDLEWTPPSDSVAVIGYLTELRQLVMNLCVNAIQSIPESGVVQVTLESTTLGENRDDRLLQVSPGEYVRLRVSDTGVGIPPECLEQIRQPFFTTKPSGQGTGLGLSVVDRAVQDHGGALLVDSTPGTGTMFDVYLPRVAELRHTTPSEGTSRHAEENHLVR